MRKAASVLTALSPRARRAVGLILLAAAVAGATSILYMNPWLALRPSGAATATPLKQHPVLQAGYVASYKFLSVALGWVVVVTGPVDIQSRSGSFWIFKTVDSARHWQLQLSGETSLVFITLSSLSFPDPSSGFVVAGDPLSLYKTRDGGDHWTRLDLPARDRPDVPYLQFTNPTHGWLTNPPSVGTWRLFATDDGGASWTRAPDAPRGVSVAPAFRGTSEGWTGASSQAPPRVFVTNDGGLTWDRRDLPIPPGVSPESEVTTFLDLLDSGAIVYVFVGADLVAALTSFDGGRSWSYTKPPASIGDRTGMSFVDSSHWWAVQRGGLYKTADAGQSWTHISEEPLGLHLIQVMDATHAWALLDEGYGTELVSSADGGVHWTPTNVPVVSTVPSN